MESSQLSHFEVTNKISNKQIVVVTQNIRTPENVGMILRISEAFGVKKVILIGDSPNLSNKKVLRTARSTEKKLVIEFVPNMDNVIDELRVDKFQLLALEATNDSSSISQYLFSKNNKIAIFIGAERFGIDKASLKQLDACVHINLFGKNSSINVVNALAIGLFEITK